MIEQLFCEIISTTASFICYRVYDKDNETISTGASTSKNWVKHDAGGFHTKEEFDKKYPQGWEVSFDF